MLYKLGWSVLKLSMEATVSPSKKNWVVICLPSLLIQVRKQPFSMKNMVLETCPSPNKIVFAGTSSGLKKGLNSSHLVDFTGWFASWSMQIVLAIKTRSFSD